jgi:hypothetical protein
LLACAEPLNYLETVGRLLDLQFDQIGIAVEVWQVVLAIGIEFRNVGIDAIAE